MDKKAVFLCSNKSSNDSGAHFEQEDGAQKSMSVFSKGAITLKMTGSK